jgi:hypothetical protein
MGRGRIGAALAAIGAVAVSAQAHARKAPLDGAVIACSLLCREGRGEAAVGGGIGFADPAVSRREANLRLIYWPLEEVGVGIEGAISRVDESDVARPYGRAVVMEPGDDHALRVSGWAAWSFASGKVAVGGTILRNDLLLVGRVGLVDHDEPRLTGGIDVAMRVGISDDLALSIGVGTIVTDTAGGEDLAVLARMDLSWVVGPRRWRCRVITD